MSPPAGDQHRQSVLETNPHLAHYIFKLVLSNQATSRAPSGTQHPLSVSSSGESDDEDDGGAESTTTASTTEPSDTASSADEGDATKLRNSSSNGRPPPPATTGPSREEREELVRKVIDLLDNDQEEDIKDLLRGPMGELGKDNFIMDQVCLDCMHRHRDDVSGLPYQEGSFTPTRARRPYTPTGLSTLRVRTPLARPHSPAALGSPSGSGAHTPTSGVGHAPSGLALGRVESAPSPSLAPGAPAGQSSSAYSSSGSPVLSPRVSLNVKAASFNPAVASARSNTSSPLSVTTSFAPSDPWRDALKDDASAPTPPRAASPYMFNAAQGMVRTGSNRAIAAPIISDPSSPFHSPLGTPTRPHMKLGADVFSSPMSTTARPASRGVVPDDDDDDEFSPFASSLPKLHHHDGTSSGLNSSAKPFEPFGGGAGDSGSSQQSTSYDSRASAEPEEDPSNASSGMTPLDVLTSVFSTVPRHELEDALHRAGYDFEAAMAILVSQYTHPRSGASTPNRVSSPRPMIGLDGRGNTNHHAPGQGYFQQGGRGYGANMNPNLAAQRNIGPTRMCRYFLNGECRRSDCRFSHDLDRALCRFWLRGHCAKGPNCEFLHNMPNMDPLALNAAMSRMDINSPGGSMPSTPPINAQYGAGDDFPDLLAARLNRTVGRFDPARNRFANAVKRPAPAPPPQHIHISGGAVGRFAPAAPAANERPAAPSQPAVPRPSRRLKLHAPTLLPTLTTGAAANEQYLNARNTSIRLGHARNACLARAADAFRRGDGAAAKRFSREGKALNEKMLNEAAEAANSLVKERMREAQQAVRERDPSWSSDPRDRAERGRECGAGLGVVLGVASASKVPGGERLSSEERLECLLDLHTLHGQEGADITGHFLAELERESYRGLAFLVVGEEKHVGTQDPLRGASKVRLANSVKQSLADWGYAWSEGAGIIHVDPCRV
ncbi:hypothetical protein Q8F55_006923 [Vanrija albida]|uniref:C3H1-type domain-containing protein n=1 Tax=Vanrija albida TaxID=181172 RepID=A0ABR3PYE6_9TREE